MESEQPYESLYDQARRTTRQPTGRDLASRASDAVTVVGGAVVGAIGHRTNRCGACGVTACVLGLAAAVAFGGVAVFEAAARPAAPPPGAVCADRGRACRSSTASCGGSRGRRSGTTASG